MKKCLIKTAVTALLLSTSVNAFAALTPMQDKVLAAMKLDYRTEADTKRDRNRDPIRALDFFRVN